MKKYQIVYADPPWSYNDKGCNGSAEGHYPTMKLKDICRLPIKDLTDTDCVLFIWVTYPMLREVQTVIKKWGFKYKTIGFQWIKIYAKSEKPFFGLGRWTRGNSEACLIATKGSPKRINNAISQLLIHPVMEHSKKPDAAREKIVELMGDLPRVELFARCKTPGWDVWGNEVESDISLSNNPTYKTRCQGCPKYLLDCDGKALQVECFTRKGEN
jgi:N6-adenosine-specific RNA methylase IME4